VGFVDKNRGARGLVQLTRPGGLTGSERFEELDRGCDDDRSVPERGQKAEIGALKLRLVMMSCNYLLRLFTRKNKCLPVYINRLLNDVRVRQHDEDMLSPSATAACSK
jgi:hypothetical protein